MVDFQGRFEGGFPGWRFLGWISSVGFHGGFQGWVSRVEIFIIFLWWISRVDFHGGFSIVSFHCGFPQWISRVDISRVEISMSEFHSGFAW